MPASVFIVYEYPDVSEEKHITSALHDQFSEQHLPEAERLSVYAGYHLKTEDPFADRLRLRVEHELCDGPCHSQHPHGGDYHGRSACQAAAVLIAVAEFISVAISVSVTIARHPAAACDHHQSDVCDNRNNSVDARRAESPSPCRKLHFLPFHVSASPLYREPHSSFLSHLDLVYNIYRLLVIVLININVITQKRIHTQI